MQDCLVEPIWVYSSSVDNTQTVFDKLFDAQENKMIKLKKLLSEADPPKQKPPAGGGGEAPEKPQKLKITNVIYKFFRPFSYSTIYTIRTPH